MARPLLAMQNHLFLSDIPIISNFIAFIAVLGVFSLVSFLCASHHRAGKSHRQRDGESLASQSSEKRLLSKINSDIREKAHSMVKMISWRKLEQDEGCDDDGSEEIWRRSIIMGERCRPLDFSGKIMYDSEGNLVPDFSTK
uniref:Transmembrane protein n=1 Tax=Salix viminalis TaxID=40686 RepID=A0A6N2K883_SALVM